MQYEVIDDRPLRRPRELDYVIRHTAPTAIRYEDNRAGPARSRERTYGPRDDRSYSPPVRRRSRRYDSRYDMGELKPRFTHGYGHYDRYSSPSPPPIIERTRERRGYGGEDEPALRIERRRAVRRDSYSQPHDTLMARVASFKFDSSPEAPADLSLDASSTILPKGKRGSTSRPHKAVHADIQALPFLTTPQRKAISRLLSDVKKNSSRPIRVSKDTTVRHMDPGVRQLDIPPSKDSRDNHITPTPVTWLCIPYFSLERYSGLSASTNPGSYPTQTLLQASYARIAYKRDMQQAARHINSGDKGWCFHIPQLWCLVIGDSVLVTCGLMDELTLRDKAISVQEEIPRPPNSKGVKGARILVKYGGSLSWSLPAEECKTFLGFAAHFHELWPAVMEFYHDQQVVSKDTWRDIFKLLQRGRSSITLSMKTKFAPPFTPSSRLHDLHRAPARIPTSKDTKSPEESSHQPSPRGRRDEAAKEFDKEDKPTEIPSRNPNEIFHVFSWIKTKSSSAADYPNLESIQGRLEQVSSLLSGDSNAAGSKAFRAASTLDRAATHARVEASTRQASDVGPSSRRFGRYRQSAIELFNTADIPQASEANRHGRDARRSTGDSPHPNIGLILSKFKDLMPNMLAFKQLMTQATDSDRAKIQVSDDLTRAWPLIVMSLIHSCTDMGSVSSWGEQLNFAISLIQSGMAETVDSLSSFRLADKITVLPMDLVSLMSIRLLSDITGKHPSASETYLEYLQGLEAQITSMPSDRSYETRINHVQEELTIAKKIVDAQKVIYGFISRTLNAGECRNTISRTRPFDHYGEGLNRSAAPHGNPFAPGNADEMALELPLSELSSVRDLLVWECIDVLERKKKEFQGYGLHAQSLERQNASKVIGTKDKQEEAIYIFTLVTIIFLPLSAVSSIFGMNTSDVRDMESGMWTYWAVAIPVTLLVILLGLWWLGELGALAAWVACKLRGQRGLSDEIPPPPYPGHQLSSMTAPEEFPGRTRNVYRERYYRPPPPVMESDDDGREGWRRPYPQREDDRLQEERYAVGIRLDRERRRAEERQLLEEKRLLDKLEVEEEAKAKMQAELDMLRREMRKQEEEAAKRAAEERMQRHRNEERERHLAEERERRLAEQKARRAAEEKAKRAAEEKQPASERERRDNSDEGTQQTSAASRPDGGGERLISTGN
ncbi:uncharacterized protein VDAG_04541 [Verticillium dahliae VdLs.17]|uniref:Uncharacterized protein n=1 Tax=Verticillium dahliae (strain VdLs.17 / ATCC MYA-4575 / FGSC 10137) TaxID=498257 RepID=G2X2L7_VERDV|nr:uncharacterized protein VDAG_04541 [Verticillium dahliae VdLs.17]EGY23103.1 hypothetical protein VDAG_04541 [Verticillium dahliae VdLs.17]